MDRKEIYSIVEYCKSDEGGLCVKCPHGSKCNDIAREISARYIKIRLIPEQWSERDIETILNLNQ